MAVALAVSLRTLPTSAQADEVLRDKYAIPGSVASAVLVAHAKHLEWLRANGSDLSLDDLWKKEYVVVAYILEGNRIRVSFIRVDSKRIFGLGTRYYIVDLDGMRVSEAGSEE